MKILIAVVLAILILSSLGMAEVGKIELRDGSVIVGNIQEPLTISIETKYGKFEIGLKDIVSISGNEIKLKDGSVLTGTAVITWVKIQPIWHAGLEIEGKYINSLSFLEEVSPAELPSPIPKETVKEETWELKKPLYIIEGETQVKGFREFVGVIENSFMIGSLGGYPLLKGVETYLKEIKESNTILLAPPSSKGIKELQSLEAKYPDLLPVSCKELNSKLKSFSSPLVYFARDKRGLIRGIIIAEQVTPLLAKLLLEEKLCLDAYLRYKNEMLEIVEKK